MGTYLLTLYVTLEQEQVIEQVFKDRSWTFRKKCCLPESVLSPLENYLSKYEVSPLSGSLCPIDESEVELKNYNLDVQDTTTLSVNAKAQTETTCDGTSGSEPSSVSTVNTENLLFESAVVSGNKNSPHCQEVDSVHNRDLEGLQSYDSSVDHISHSTISKDSSCDNVTKSHQNTYNRNSGRPKKHKTIESLKTPKRRKSNKVAATKESGNQLCNLTSKVNNGQSKTTSNKMFSKYSSSLPKLDDRVPSSELPVLTVSEEESVSMDTCCHGNEDEERDKVNKLTKQTALRKRKQSTNCSDCGLIFENTSKLKDHKRSDECVTTCNTCDICGKVYKKYERELLDVHLRQHKGELPFQCDDCGKMFAGKAYLSRHKQRHNLSQEMPYFCDICKKQFTQKELLRRHMKNMHGDRTKKFQCDICGNVFLYKGSLTQHYKSVHVVEKLFTCDVCDKKFKAAHNLRIHMVTHSEENKDVCNICGKTFKRRSAFNVHMNRHQNKRKFSCKTCGKQFFEGREVTEHMRIHTGERPFKCDRCDYSCAIRGNLTKHMKVHDKESIPTTIQTTIQTTNPTTIQTTIPTTSTHIATSHSSNRTVEVALPAETCFQRETTPMVSPKEGEITQHFNINTITTPTMPDACFNHEAYAAFKDLPGTTEVSHGYLVGKPETSEESLMYRQDYLDVMHFGNIVS